jgi:hypothetical protein
MKLSKGVDATKTPAHSLKCNKQRIWSVGRKITPQWHTGWTAGTDAGERPSPQRHMDGWPTHMQEAVIITQGKHEKALNNC